MWKPCWKLRSKTMLAKRRRRARVKDQRREPEVVPEVEVTDVIEDRVPAAAIEGADAAAPETAGVAADLETDAVVAREIAAEEDLEVGAREDPESLVPQLRQNPALLAPQTAMRELCFVCSWVNASKRKT